MHDLPFVHDDDDYTPLAPPAPPAPTTWTPPAMSPIGTRSTPRTPKALYFTDAERAIWTSIRGADWLRALLASTPYPTEE
jgi:hypothetical protein